MGNGTSLGKVRGLGSSHEGAHHWLVQRFTAIGNVVLTIWLVASILMLPDMSYGTWSAYLSGAVPATAMVLLIICVFWHAHHGLQVLIEDYVHTAGNKFAALALLNLAAIGGAAAGIFFVVRIVMTAQGDAAAEGALAELQNSMGAR
ncbi:succinate dehydrogenase, hydrophobic membrane anchor protein [Pontixanthobacter aestiaquae]|uniref:Succinate dehydrogenase hydrophobic membrane anchor subunit n=1 Tax=Pontixanthobacter aestiaquae TaxID=1509367 RepID=A0A844Z791_9SPHN|nr:succinate dehydrogenase, hydrophobic membrane anchor protein [Pontixanthobacter aestiaquae]MDN3645223.1 succinate dehydrogenase, hydrophobic membrane anchor protein [Pontixanthobacter aestiaquae]MXO83775.1 succinate dehydrogenase, hydrophobic membrane anchor protein [Pontixanthobacter aestiaquae]